MAKQASGWSKDSSPFDDKDFGTEVSCAYCCEAICKGQAVKDNYIYELDYLDYIELAHASCVEELEREILQDEVERAERAAGWDPNP